MKSKVRIERLTTDILIIGGGTAGCYAALTVREHSNLPVIIAEEANIKRSGCLAAGVNAINAYIINDKVPEDYVEYAKKDAENIKPILADAVSKLKDVSILNHVNVIDYIVRGNQILGVFAIDVEEQLLYQIRAKAVICTTGGAAGDVAGGCPQKYVSGALVEGEIAAKAAVEKIKKNKESYLLTEIEEEILIDIKKKEIEKILN